MGTVALNPTAEKAMGLMPRISQFIRIPILRGPMRGKKWIVASGGKTLRMLFYTYEPAQSSLFEKYLHKGYVVFEAGAHLGYYTLLASTLTGDAGRVIAFEPDPRNTFFLRRHVKINRCSNVDVVEAAVSGECGYSGFSRNGGSGTGHLSASGTLLVKIITLDRYVDDCGLIPDAIKIDTEGAEMMVLQGAEQILCEGKPVLFLSTHSPELDRQCRQYLADYNYDIQVVAVNQDESAFELLCTPK